MADDDDRRVEAKPMLVGRGSGTTPERIAEIQERAARLERVVRPEPAKSFAEVMGEKSVETEEEELSEKEKKRRALPKKGPRPALVHPSQREVMGREDEEEEEVILKG